MQKNEINILIVEDDATLGAALREAVVRAGYSATLTAKPEEALSSIRLQVVHAAFIDCMLPQMNGRDLALKISKEASETAIFLMSGIFKDKNFAREAIQQTGAASFFIKPFDLNEVIKALDARFEGLLEPPKAAFHDVLLRPQLSKKERLFAVNNSDAMNGLDLPWIYSLLIHPRISGHLNIATAEGEVVGVGFHHGKIVQVILQDNLSYFGLLLVERGFLSAGDLEAVIAEGGTRARRLGDTLVEMNLLSPHAVDLVVSEQLGIRLSKTIGITSVKTNFIDSEDIRQDAQLERHAFNELLHDWVASKYPIEWLKAFYMPWMRYSFVKAEEWSDNHRLFNLPLLSSDRNFAADLISGKSLEELHSKNDQSEDIFYRRLHLLVSAHMVSFSETGRAAVDYTILQKRLMKLTGEFNKQNHFERLGLSPKAKAPEIKRAYHELAKVLHPDRANDEMPEEVQELTRVAFGMINDAYSVLSDAQKREDYTKVIEQSHAEKMLEIEAIIDQGRKLLFNGESTKALATLQKVKKGSRDSANLKLHIWWAQLTQPGKEHNPDTIDLIDEGLPSIAPEDRHSATYLFVKGLLAKAKNDIDTARKMFENASGIDSDFIPAKRELNLIKLKTKEAKDTDLLRGDLRDVVGKLFKKR